MPTFFKSHARSTRDILKPDRCDREFSNAVRQARIRKCLPDFQKIQIVCSISFKQPWSPHSKQNEGGLSRYAQSHNYHFKFKQFDDLVLKNPPIHRPLKNFSINMEKNLQIIFPDRWHQNISIKPIKFPAVHINFYDHHQVYISTLILK